MHRYRLDYLFNNEPRSHVFELETTGLSLPEATMHLLQLHFGDSENNLLMPNADATPEQILEQAERVGLTRIEIVKEPR